MSRVSEVFENKKALITFITGGDPDLDTTQKLILEMQKSGADMIEIGIPFSDPIAESAIIQQADIRALNAGCTTDKLFEALKDVKEQMTIPLVFMTYANVIYRYGTKKFFERCVECGISGVIIPDCPYEEREEFAPFCTKAGIDFILSVAPASEQKIAKIAKSAQGFVYVTSTKNLRSMKSNIITDLRVMIKTVKESADIPCVVGCENNTPQQAADVCRYADGVINLDTIVNIVAEQGRKSVPYVGTYVKKIKDAVR